MKAQYFLAILSVFVLTSAQAEVYRSVNDQGVVVYSDTPSDGAKTVDLPGVDTFTSIEGGGSSDSEFSSDKAVSGDGSVYSSVSITSPANDSTLRNAQTVVVTVNSDPPLRDGDQVVISFGAETIKTPKTSYTFENVERGTHIISAHIEDTEGTALSDSVESTLHVQKTSAIQRKRANTANAARNNP